MKQASTILTLCLLIAVPAGADEEAAQPHSSDSLTRWHPPALSITRDSETPTVPLSKLVESVHAAAEKQEVFLNGLRGIVVSVHNTTDRALVVDAEKATAVVDGGTYRSAGTRAVDIAACPENQQPAKAERTVAGIVLGAVTIGAMQTVRDARIQKGPVLDRYGCDEARRRDEVGEFGSRVVWPGDTRKGIIYFAAQSSLAGATITLPISALYDPSDATTIEVSF